MVFFTNPTAFRLNNEAIWNAAGQYDVQQQIGSPWTILKSNPPPPPHSSHPNFLHLAMLIFEAVLEVVCVSLPGYIVARQGLFTAEMQKFTANLNVALFTPCLIFVKLASQLSADKLVDLAIIPVIFVVQTLISFLCSFAIAAAFRLPKRPRNFVIAMGVFGNSNSLPISLVTSLSKTIRGLHWDKMPHDNDDEVAARGILYLLIFQQLGQLVRWSWGYNVLLAPPDKVEGTDESTNSQMENGGDEEERQRLIDDTVDDDADNSETEELNGSDATRVGDPARVHSSLVDSDVTLSGAQTPVTHQQVTSSSSSTSSKAIAKRIFPTPTNGNMKPNMSIPKGVSGPSSSTSDGAEIPAGIRAYPARARSGIQRGVIRVKQSISDTSYKGYKALPQRLQSILAVTWSRWRRFWYGVWDFMNPPLWAMLVAIVVASIPNLQRFFFTPGTFVRNSITSAVESNAGVAIPLILVVLGGNLAGNTLPQDARSKEDAKDETRIVIAAIISRMVFPFVIMAPLLAVTAKFVPVSILDDPIFVIVCFLITGAPSALQLAQICQINNVYMGAMSRLLFQSYVIWILPSTLILVMTALEVVEWAKR